MNISIENNLHLPARTKVFREGNLAEKLYIVKRGQVLCLKSSKDRLIPIFLAKEGDILGESAVVVNVNHTYSAITLSDVELIEVEAHSFHSVLDKGPKWTTELIMTMISRHQKTSNLIAENRIVDSSIISDEEYTSEVEIEFKKILA